MHRMPSHQSIIEWYKSTGMKEYLAVLSDEDKIKFEKDVFKEVEKQYPVQQNGEIIFRFPRLFFTVIK
ncbi:MAG: trans-aconitate methyltransferase, partial [Eubacterium sp.]|nr:trans-aconitate methyltransferase [Eubacterium sp.]